MARLPFYRDGIRFECQQSGRCCLSRGEYGFVYLTDADAERLAVHLGLSVAELVKRHCAHTEGHLHLKDPDKDCRFLDGTACGVYEARPQQCRTWPFWPENLKDARTWKQEVAAYCPGIGKGRLYTASEIAAILASGQGDDEDEETQS